MDRDGRMRRVRRVCRSAYVVLKPGRSGNERKGMRTYLPTSLLDSQAWVHGDAA